MPLLLDTPLPVIPELDSEASSYTQVAIVSFSYRTNQLTLVCAYGNTFSGQWKSGNIPRKTFVLEGTDFDSIIVELSQGGETLFQGVSRVLYQYLIDGGHYEGTIV